MDSEMITKCSTCNLQIIFKMGENLVRCPWCDRINERPKSNPEKTSSMKLANELRNMGEFAKAQDRYLDVLAANDKEHEARWGLLLCKYGVIYVEDNRENRRERLITCRRSLSSSIQDEAYYQIVLDQASPEVRAVYEKDAAYIDQIQGQIRLLRLQDEKPYDVFLCYKETAPEGGKTEDSAIAHQIYNSLTRSDYRVFFAPESLKEKAGANYEAAIFGAIENSRVMLVLGTKKEYFEGTWVRSEWRRFLERLDLGDEKTLIPLFRSVADLPDTFQKRMIQGYDMNLPYMEYIKTRLNKLLRKEDSRYTLAMIFLHGGNFQSAGQYLDQLLVEQPKNPKIWLAKAMVTEQVRQEEELSQLTHSLLDNFFFHQALDFAVGSFRERLESCLRQNKETIQAAESARKAEEIHREAEKKAREEAEEKARREEAERARKEAEERTRREEVERVRKEAEEKAHREEAERARKEAEERARREAEKRAWQETAAKNRREAEEKERDAEKLCYQYRIILGGNAEIKSYHGNRSEIVIPYELDGHRVTSIGRMAFYGCDHLTRVTIPNGVTVIDMLAFGECASLTSVTIPYSVTNIGISAFFGCTKLASMNIPNSVNSIGDLAFWNCSSLTSVILPNSVTSIGDYAFSRCSALTSINLPDSVVHLGRNPFIACGSLTSIHLSEHHPRFRIKDGVLFNQTMQSLICYPAGKPQTDYSIPSGVTSIGDAAFYGCSRLTNVTIPDGVTSISVAAFSECSSLTGVTIPNSVTVICIWAFYACRSLTKLSLPDSVNTIGEDAFCGCVGLTSLTIPSRVTRIYKWTFERCSGLTNVYIPASVVNISDRAFIGCNKVTIYGAAGSQAETFARANRIPFTAAMEYKRKAEEQQKMVEELLRSDIWKENGQQSTLWKKNGQCAYCGGKFNLFNKCKSCGRKKDY